MKQDAIPAIHAAGKGSVHFAICEMVLAHQRNVGIQFGEFLKTKYSTNGRVIEFGEVVRK